MANANIDKVTARVLWILGGQSGTFNTTVSDDRFILEEIQRSIIETEEQLVRTICSYGHPERMPFVTFSSIGYAATLPKRIGEIVSVRCLASDNTEKEAEYTSRTNIENWRSNPNNIYSSLPHTDKDSILFGYFNITNDVIYYTGSNAKVFYCQYTPNYTTPALSISDYFEDALVCGTITRLFKDGVPVEIVQVHSQIYANILEDIKATGINKIDDVTERSVRN
jgi:hypothetical protein